MSYDPIYYQKNKESFRAAEKKWQAKVRQEKISKGELYEKAQISLTLKESRLADSIFNSLRRLSLEKEKVQKQNENAAAYHKNRMNTDPVFRAKRLQYYKMYRIIQKISNV